VAAFLLIDLSDVAQFVISAGGLEELATVVANAGLAQFEMEYSFFVGCRVHEERGAVVVCFRLDRVFIFEQQPHYPDIDAKFFSVRQCTGY
jgi:hypothetical protein